MIASNGLFAARRTENGCANTLRKAEAETFAQIKNTELLNQGLEGHRSRLRCGVMAQREEERLQPYGKTLTDAVDYYLKHLEATTCSVSISQAMTELIANRKASGAYPGGRQ